MNPRPGESLPFCGHSMPAASSPSHSPETPLFQLKRKALFYPFSAGKP